MGAQARPRVLTARRRAILIPLALLLALAACDRNAADTPSSSATSSAPMQTSTIATPAGGYRYEGLGVTAVLTFDGRTGALEIKNDTGVELGEPHLYVFRADDGRRFDLTTTAPEPVPPGPTAAFEVGFDDDPPPIGMVFLMFGEDDFGAFVQVPTAAG